MEDYKKLYEELKKNEKIDFSKQMEFISALQKEPSPEKINFYFHLLKDKSNTDLFLALRAFFDKFGLMGENFLLDFLSKSDDKELIAEAIMILGGHNYHAEKVLPYVHRYINDENADLRYRCIICLGWIGEKEDLSILKKCVLTERSAENKGYAVSAMRQMWFRHIDLKDDILKFCLENLANENEGLNILIYGLCIQTLLKKNVGITESEKGITSKRLPAEIKEKALKLLADYFM